MDWCLAQLGANATLAPFIATISDQVPKFQRGSVSALLGIAQSIGILGGTYLADIFAERLVVLFVVPSLVVPVVVCGDRLQGLYDLDQQDSSVRWLQDVEPLFPDPRCGCPRVRCDRV